MTKIEGVHWNIGEGPVLATAIHHGHWIRPEVLEYLALSQSDRLREEDPFTGDWTCIGAHRLVVERSRFECDLNRTREEAVYTGPGAAWGLDLYRESLPDHVRGESLAFYDAFYREVETFVNEQLEQHTHLLAIDLHSYNHRRNGPDSKPADKTSNPEINLGTTHLTKPEKWAAVIDTFESVLQSSGLDARHDINFEGGHFPQWLNRKWPGRMCAVAVEVKKIFMDEWTGQRD